MHISGIAFLCFMLLLGQYLIAGLACIMSDAFDDYGGGYLIKLPWPIIALTAFPFFWPFYLKSYLSLRAKRREAEQIRQFRLMRPTHQVREFAAGRYLGPDDDDDGHYPRDNRQDYIEAVRRRIRQLQIDAEEPTGYLESTSDDAEDASRQFAFADDPAAASELYFAMRGKRRTEGVKRRLQSAESSLERTTEELRELSEKIKDLQAKRGEIAKTIRNDKTALAQLESQPETAHQALEAEFAKISQLTGVVGVRAFGEYLSVLVEGRITYKRTVYDKGDWELRIHPTNYRLWSMERRSGIRPEWRSGRYPDYRLDGDSFCFGSMESTISTNIQAGQYLQALELAVACIHAVNSDDIDSIPRAFKKVKKKVKQ